MALSNTDLAIVQFIIRRDEADLLFGRYADIAHQFKKGKSEPAQKRIPQFTSGNGRKLIETKEPIRCCGSLGQLEAAGFEMVGFWWQRQFDKDLMKVRFTFARKLRNDAHPAFLKARDSLQCLFARLVNQSFWGLQVFDNPLLSDGLEVQGRRAMSINFKYRHDKQKGAVRILALEDENFILRKYEKAA